MLAGILSWFAIVSQGARSDRVDTQNALKNEFQLTIIFLSSLNEYKNGHFNSNPKLPSIVLWLLHTEIWCCFLLTLHLSDRA